MKIAIIDECNSKFTTDLREHWEKSHEVKFDKYFDPKLVLWADTTFFDFAGNNVQRASDSNDSFWKDVPQPKDKNIILRVHDLDIWVGQHTRINYNWINHLVFVSKLMQQKALPEIRLPQITKVHLIKHGVNSEKFIYREKPLDKKIAWIGNICDHKKLETALLILAELSRDYSLYVLGGGLVSWRKAYVDHYIQQNNLNVEFVEHVDDMNEWLEDKDFLLHTGTKEAFSFISAEAGLKGIKFLVHNFPGCKDIWPEHLIWNTVSDAKQLILEDRYESMLYCNYVKANYSLPKMLEEYDKILK